MEKGAIEAETAVQDGTSMRASGSRHRLLTLSKVEQRRGELVKAVGRDEGGERLEDAPGWMAKTEGGRKEQLERYKRAEEELRGRIEREARKPASERRVALRISPTDMEAAVGRDKEKVYCPLYTAVYLVDKSSSVILSWDVYAKPTDAGTLLPLLDEAQRRTGGRVRTMLADGAFANVLDIVGCQERGIDLVSPPREEAEPKQGGGKGRKGKAGRKGRARSQGAACNGGRGKKGRFEWLAELDAYRCPAGHLLRRNGQELVWRRDGEQLVRYRYYCPVRYCRSCPEELRCV